MIQAALQVADRLSTLLHGQGEPNETVFTGVIDPMFRDAESVVYDYTSLHLDLIMELYTQTEAAGVIHWLEGQRLDFLPLCVKVRELAAQNASDRHHTHANAAMVKFRQGILGLMQGSVSLVEGDEVPLERFGYSGPTLLHQLYSQFHSPLSVNRSLCVEIAKKQFQAIERAWEHAVEGYAALKFAMQATKRYETRAALLLA
jgi:hypothetical protein